MIILTLIGPGEVKVDPANFDLKLQEKLLSTSYIFLPIPAERSSGSFWTSDMTSKNDGLTCILTYFCHKSGHCVPCQTPPPSARFYCIYRPPERGRSPAGPWSAVRCGASQQSSQFPVPGHVECGWRWVLSRAHSLVLSKWTAGAASIWGISQNWRPL